MVTIGVSTSINRQGFAGVNRNTKKYEPRHDKTNKMTVCPAKTDQPGHSPSLIRVFAVRSMDPSFLRAVSEDSDQTGRMPRLIRVFAGRTVTLLGLS